MQRLVFLMLGILVALAVVALMLFTAQRPGSSRPTADAPLPGRMAEVEEPTEAFANALHACSVAILLAESEGMAACFAAEVEGTPFPLTPGHEEPAPAGLLSHGWDMEPPGRWPRAAWLERLEGMLQHYAAVEDMRLKVKASSASADGTRVEGRMALWLIGRDARGRREWLHGYARVAATRGTDGSWPLERFEFESLHAEVAPGDSFRQVAEEAGLGATDPPVLDHPTLGLAAYGAATADVNGDGLMDLFSAGQDGNALYLSQGDGTFRDVAAEAFIRVIPTPAAGALFLDMDNDGDQDLFLSSFGPQYLFENRLVPDGRLVFRDISQQAGVDRHAVGFSAVAGDINQDGLPDIYVTSYNDYGRILPDRWDAGRNGTANLLFVNQGQGIFREEARERGVSDPRWSYAAAFVDIDGDADQDLYVANDFGGGNSLFINDGGQFSDRAGEHGVFDGGYAMGASFGDYDRDGDLDLHVTRMSSTAGRRILARLDGGVFPDRERLAELAAGNALYQNQGDGTFRDVSAAAGPFSAGWAWGGGFLDFNNDGFEDLHVPNGFLSGSSMKDT